MQENMINELFTKENINKIKYDIHKIPQRLQYLKSLCTCPHGYRTVGICAHRTAFLLMLRGFLLGESIDEPNHISKRNGDISINIENKHQWKQTKMGVMFD